MRKRIQLAPSPTLTLTTARFENAGLLRRLGESLPTPSSMEQLDDMYHTVHAMAALDYTLIDEAVRFGMPISFKFEQNGTTVQNIFPIKSMAEKQISSSSSTELMMHTETAFHPKRPDYVFLYCLRGDESVGTTFAYINDILAQLSIEDIELMMQERFSVKPDLSFVMAGASPEESTISLLDKHATELIYDTDAVTGLDSEATAVLARIQAAVEKSIQSVTLKDGDILVLPNLRYVHGRSPFKANFDGNDRWLKRILLRSFEKAKLNPNDGIEPLT